MSGIETEPKSLLGLYASLVADRFMSFSDAVGRLMRKEVAAGVPDLDAAQDRVMTWLVAEISREEGTMDKAQTTRLTAQEFATRTTLGTQQSLAASQIEVTKAVDALKDRPKLSMG